MTPWRRAIAHALVLAALFAAPWPAAGRAYGRWVAAIGTAVLGTGPLDDVELGFGPRADVADPGDAWHLPVWARHRATGQVVVSALDLRRSGYLACALFAALALAVPVPWQRRLVILGAGLIPLQLLPLLPLLSLFSGHLPLAVFDLGPAARAVADIAYRALVAPPGMAFAVPILLWLLLVVVLTEQPPAKIAATE